MLPNTNTLLVCTQACSLTGPATILVCTQEWQSGLEILIAGAMTAAAAKAQMWVVNGIPPCLLVFGLAGAKSRGLAEPVCRGLAEAMGLGLAPPVEFVALNVSPMLIALDRADLEPLEPLASQWLGGLSLEPKPSVLESHGRAVFAPLVPLASRWVGGLSLEPMPSMLEAHDRAVFAPLVPRAPAEPPLCDRNLAAEPLCRQKDDSKSPSSLWDRRPSFSWEASPLLTCLVGLLKSLPLEVYRAIEVHRRIELGREGGGSTAAGGMATLDVFAGDDMATLDATGHPAGDELFIACAFGCQSESAAPSSGFLYSSQSTAPSPLVLKAANPAEIPGAFLWCIIRARPRRARHLSSMPTDTSTVTPAAAAPAIIAMGNVLEMATSSEPLGSCAGGVEVGGAGSIGGGERGGGDGGMEGGGGMAGGGLGGATIVASVTTSMADALMPRAETRAAGIVAWVVRVWLASWELGEPWLTTTTSAAISAVPTATLATSDELTLRAKARPVVLTTIDVKDSAP